MTSLTDLREVVDVVIGVDTHVQTHSAAAVDARTGGVLGEITVDATAEGYERLVEFAEEHAVLRAWAVEGTGGHGAGLARGLVRREEIVVELDRPERARRRNGAKSDPLDAIRAAREALARPRLGTPRSSGDRQALSVLLAARRSAVTGATEAQQQLFSLVIAAPESIRQRFRGQQLPGMLKTAAALRVHASWDVETTTTVTTLRSLARRARALSEEAADYEKSILRIVRSWRPDLLEQFGVGPIVAAVVLCAWSHPGRIHSEAAFAMLAGAAPIPANSGQVTTRHRLNRYGDRQLNRALHTIALSRIRYHQPTRAYVDRRTTEGKTTREIKRCLIGGVSEGGRAGCLAVALGRVGGWPRCRARSGPALVLPPPTRRGPRPALGTCPTEGRTMRNRRRASTPTSQPSTPSGGQRCPSSAGIGQAELMM